MFRNVQLAAEGELGVLLNFFLLHLSTLNSRRVVVIGMNGIKWHGIQWYGIA